MSSSRLPAETGSVVLVTNECNATLTTTLPKVHIAISGIEKLVPTLGLLYIPFIILVIVGALVLLAPKLPWLGKLPGDISLKRGNFSLYFPLGTCILISIILTLIMYLFRR